MPSDSSAEHWKIKVEQWKFCYWGFLLLLSPPPPSKIHQWHGALCKCSTILFHAKKLPWGLRWGWSWCQKRPVQVIKLPAGEGNAFIRSVSEHGSEVLRSSSSCPKARGCKACLGFQWAALWATACGTGTKSFVSHWQCCWVCSLPAAVWTVFYFFSFFTGRNPIENTWSDTISA